MKKPLRLRFLVCAILISMFIANLSAQTEAGEAHYPELFMGVDFNYRNIHFNNRIYDLLIYLTPGMKWKLRNNWQIAAQGLIPVVNNYGERYKKVRLNMAVLSKEFYPGRQFLKVSGGLFNQERYGIDMKWMFPVNRWLAFNGQAGYTGYCSMAKDWESSKVDRITGLLGAQVYLEKYNTEFRLHGGRFIFRDYGVTGECMRHFKHSTIGVYAQYGENVKENGGFKIVIMIPPYTRKKGKVNLRPASNFRLTYNVWADPYSMRMYATDPEENEREGHFDRNRLKWGSNNMEADFREKGGEI